ncbi:MAG: hypothetical protein WBM17_13680 [Anaerolineales bacterium]
MTDKKCPKCHLWNSEMAEICDCGYNFRSEETDYSIIKFEEYSKLFQANEINGEDIRSYHKTILLRFLLCLTIPFLLSLSLYQWLIGYTTLPFIFFILAIIVNRIYRNKYIGYVINRLWKYPLIGVFLGWIFTKIVGFALMGYTIISAKGVVPEDGLGITYYFFFLIVLYLSGLAGLYIGKRKVIDEIHRYFHHSS